MREPRILRRLAASDLLAIQRQPSQLRQHGQLVEVDFEDAAEVAAQDESWTLLAGDTVLGCFGIAETFPRAVGVAWAVMATMDAADKLTLTRHSRDLISRSRLPRIEALTIARDAEEILARFPGLDPGQLLAAVMADPTPECRWAAMVGLTPAAVIRKFGHASETNVLFERIR